MRSHPGKVPDPPITARCRPPPELARPCALTPNAATRGMPPSVAAITLPEVFPHTMKNTPPHSPIGAIPKKCCIKNTQSTCIRRASWTPSRVRFYHSITTPCSVHSRAAGAASARKVGLRRVIVARIAASATSTRTGRIDARTGSQPPPRNARTAAIQYRPGTAIPRAGRASETLPARPKQS